MDLRLTAGQKFFMVFIALTLSLIGFMLKLPSPLRHIDKHLHAAFYFLSAAFLNILFVKRRLMPHIAIFILLFLFGVAIEWAQGRSNSFFRKRIHGRFDPEDIEANLARLMGFSAIWLIFVIAAFIYKKLNPPEHVAKSNY